MATLKPLRPSTAQDGPARPPNGAARPGYRVQVSDDFDAPEWDTFLAETPGGQHVQSGLWARVKAPLGWRVARVVASQGGRIVGGAQLLARPLPLAGAVGYVREGPVLALDDPELLPVVMEPLLRVAEGLRVRLLVLQPPQHGEALARRLPAWGFRPSPIHVWPKATTRIDLAPSLDDLLGRMREKTRYNIRLGERKGIEVREGGQDDLNTFHALLEATGRRQGFFPDSKEHLSYLWHVLHPSSHARLFLAEHRGEAVSGLLAIPFGDSVTYQRGAWSGTHGGLRPNEVMHWAAIRWAKSAGYRYYDFDGVDPEAARKVMAGERLDGPLAQSVTRFKLGFGGRVTLYPGISDRVSPAVMRRAYEAMHRSVVHSPVSWRVLKALRGR